MIEFLKPGQSDFLVRGWPGFFVVIAAFNYYCQKRAKPFTLFFIFFRRQLKSRDSCVSFCAKSHFSARALQACLEFHLQVAYYLRRRPAKAGTPNLRRPAKAGTPNIFETPNRRVAHSGEFADNIAAIRQKHFDGFRWLPSNGDAKDDHAGEFRSAS